MKRGQVIASDKSNLRKVDFLLKSDFQVITFFIPFGGRISCCDSHKYCLQMSPTIISGHHKIMSDSFIFSKYFSDWLFDFIMVMWLYYFPKYDAKMIATKF